MLSLHFFCFQVGRAGKGRGCVFGNVVDHVVGDSSFHAHWDVFGRFIVNLIEKIDVIKNKKVAKIFVSWDKMPLYRDGVSNNLERELEPEEL